MNSNTLALAPVDDDADLFDEINGNWDEVRQALSAQMPRGIDYQAITRSIEANARAAQIALFGGPVQVAETDENRGMTSVPTRGGSVVRTYWWGFSLEISPQDVHEIVNAADGAVSIIDAISPLVPAVVRPFLSIVRLFLEGAKQVLRALDRGRGVRISMSWFFAGILIPESIV